jgi:hypothetical protein
VTVTVDPGAAFSVVNQAWLKANSHVVFHPGSSAELCQLHDPSQVGGFIKGSSATIRYVVRNASIGLGDGCYPVNFQVVPGAAFDITLGLDFLWGYAARLVPRSFTNRGSGAQLVLPVPQQFRKKGVPARPPPAWWAEKRGGTPYMPMCYVPARYVVHTRRAAVTVVGPGHLASL